MQTQLMPTDRYIKNYLFGRNLVSTASDEDYSSLTPREVNICGSALHKSPFHDYIILEILCALSI